jgi:hypothetical protein
MAASSEYRFGLFVRDSAANWSPAAAGAQDTTRIPDMTPPAPLAALTATALTRDSINLLWDTTGKSSDAFQTLIRYKMTLSPTPDYPNDTGSGTLLNLFPLTNTTFKQGGLTEKRYFWYSAWIKDSSGNFSTVRQDSAFTPDQTPPANVSGLTALALGSTSVRLAWTPSASLDMDSVMVRYQTGSYPSSDASGTKWRTRPGSLTADTVTSLVEKTQYYFSLFVRDSAGNWSAAAAGARDSALTPALNTPPVITAAAADTATEDIQFRFVAIATDDQGSPVITFQNLPSWLRQSGDTVTGTPLEGVGDTAFTMTASDGYLSASQTVNLTVLAVNDPPLFTVVPESTVNEHATYSQLLTATDPEQAALTFNLTISPGGMAVSASGRISWTPASTQLGLAAVTVLVSDPAGARDTLRFTVTVRNINDPPAFSRRADTITIAQGTPWSYSFAAADPDAGDLLVYSFAGNPPDSLQSNADSLIIRWMPANADVGAYSFQVQVADQAGLGDTLFILLNVANLNDPPEAFITSVRCFFGAAQVSFRGQDIDAGDTGLDYTLLFSRGDSLLRFTTSTPGTQELYPLATGTYPVQLIVSDRNGVLSLADTASDTVRISPATGSPDNSPVLRADQWYLVSYPVKTMPNNYRSDSTANLYFWDMAKPKTELLYYQPSGIIDSLILGRGYWFRSGGQSIQLSLPASTSFTREAKISPHRTVLNPGWNMAGNPYPFAIDAQQASLAGQALAQLPVAYEDSGYNDAGLLLPWKGYWIFNPSAGPETLSLNPVASFSASPPLAKTLHAVYRNDADWSVEITARSGRTLDRGNFLGINPGASDGLDGMDQREPPLPLTGFSLRFYQPNWDTRYSAFKSDIRQHNQGTNIWYYSVLGQRDGAVRMEFAGVDQIPAKYSVFSGTAGNLVDLRKQGAWAAVVKKGEEQYFMFVVTDDRDFIQKLYLSFRLEQNNPNPFNPVTRIDYVVPFQWTKNGRPLADRIPVSLEIYNVRGQIVRTLVRDMVRPGNRFTAIWNGRNTSGEMSSSGIYFYRLRAGTFLKTRTMVLVK